MAAAIEQNHDENGIIWPMAIAPYHCIIVPVSIKDEQIASVAQQLYQEFQDAGVETVFDDRDERPGVKFKDADLIGYPLRVTIGSKALAQGKVELFQRKNGQVELVDVDKVCSKVKSIIDTSLNK